jgi:Transmembrane secretion effector
MPGLLPADLLTQGNAFNSASQTAGSSFIGPAIGGVIVAAGGTATAFALDAATFAASALCLLLMTRIPAPPASGRSVVADARQGLRWTVRQRWLCWGASPRSTGCSRSACRPWAWCSRGHLPAPSGSAPRC